MNILSYILIYTGLTAILIGSFGVARLPDLYSRLQASGASDTVGVILTLIGFLIRKGFHLNDFFLGLLIFFIFATGPIVTHSIAKAGFLSKIEPHNEGKE